MSISNQQLYELCGALNNGVITPEQHAQLEAALSEDSEARQRYYDYLDVHLQLQRRFTRHDPLELASSSHFTPTAEAPTPPLAERRRWSPWMNFAAIAATLLVVLGFQHWRRGAGIESATDADATFAAAEFPQTYIATLTKSADCVWEGDHGPKFDGQRLLTNELQLKEGIAEFRFDSGVRIVIEGPASLTIDSATSALLTSGNVVLHGSEMPGPFSLRTPVVTLLDIGTEYGAAVEPDGATEVHVFQGEVSVSSYVGDDGTLEPQQMTIGQASRFDSAGSTPVGFDTARFKRHVPESQLPSMKRKNALLAHEGFDYKTAQLNNANGGVGWAGPWRGWYGDDTPSLSEVLPGDALGHGSCLKVFGQSNVSWRQLKTPIRLDVDGVYYLSFLISKASEIERGKSQYGSIELRTADFPTDDSKLSVGMSSERNLSMTHNKQQMLSAPAIPLDKTIRFVVKIVAGKDLPDQVFTRWYGPAEAMDATEPYIWTAHSQPEDGNAVFNQLSIRVGGDVAFLVDEVRLGTTWAAVAEGQTAEPNLNKASDANARQRDNRD